MTTYYLYVKTHNVTGLKYLGQTKRLDYHKYRGSGKYWKSHLKQHGFNYTTKLLLETTDKEILKLFGVYYSKLWNVIESDDWANLSYERGEGGGPINRQITELQREKISKSLTGRKFTESHRKNLSLARTGKLVTEETREKMSNSHRGRVAWNKGKIGLTKRSGYKWWNNGFIQTLSIDCPDDTFKKGRLNKEKYK